MENNIHLSDLFKGLSLNEAEALLEGHSKNLCYQNAESVLEQGETYNRLLIVLSGKLSCRMTDKNGNTIVIEEIEALRTVAPAILYAGENKIPVSVYSIGESCLKSIPMNDFTHIMQEEERVLVNFLRIMSDRSKFLSEKVRLLRFGTIKSKLANYLLQKMRENQSTSFEIHHTQQELSDMFGVTRPALAHALSELVKEGVLRSHKKQFEILQKDKLSNL